MTHAEYHLRSRFRIHVAARAVNDVTMALLLSSRIYDVVDSQAEPYGCYIHASVNLKRNETVNSVLTSILGYTPSRVETYYQAKYSEVAVPSLETNNDHEDDGN